MNNIDIDTTLVDNYFTLLKSLSPENKQKLINRLSESMTVEKKKKDQSWKSLFGALVLDQTADEFVDELKKDRTFNRKSIDLGRNTF